MQHSSKDVIYCLSYPRSGSTWFRYCFAFITDTEIDKELLFHSHGMVNDLWTLKDTFDVKSILLLRNYKECIVSEMRNVYLRSHKETTAPTDSVLTYPFDGTDMALSFMDNIIEITKHMATEFNPALHKFTSDDWDHLCNTMRDNPDHAGWENPAMKCMGSDIYIKMWLSHNTAADNFYHSMKAEIDKVFGDFVLSDFPLFDSDYVENVEINRFPIESVLSLSAPNHYHFALQLIRYYELLEYHNKVSKANPNNALLVKYEDFIKDPFTELSKVIDFMEEARLATSDRINMFRDNLYKLVGDIEHHKSTSVTKYRNRPERRTGFLAHSYGRDPEYNFHSSICRKEFLIEIDNVLKNKNLELYNQYLSDYEEKAD